MISISLLDLYCSGTSIRLRVWLRLRLRLEGGKSRQLRLRLEGEWLDQF